MREEYKQIVKERILDRDNFIRATFSGQAPGTEGPWKKVVLRPVLIRDSRRTQFSYFDERRDISKNYSGAEVPAKLDELFALDFRNIHVDTTHSTLQVHPTKGGEPRVHEAKVDEERRAPDPRHDRRKQRTLPADHPDRFLQAVGIMTAEGKVRADKQDKFRQINEFLKLVRQTIDAASPLEAPVSIVDCGCGNAYLTFATYHYFAQVMGLPVNMTGIDVQGELLTKHEAEARALGWKGLTFQATNIIDYLPSSPPDIVLALHACDTATDEALAQGIRWRSRRIFSSPCCHHHIQAQLARTGVPAPFGPVYRHGILGERMGDILTDTLRALILRIMGYRTEVVQFVSTEHTARNLMIRAMRVGASDISRFVREYKELVAYWQVTPYLQELLGEEFERTLATEP